MSPKSSRAPKKPKRSLFDATGSAKNGASKSGSDNAKPKSGGNKSAPKKRATEAAADQENPPVTDTSEPKTIEPGKKTGEEGAVTKPALKKRKTEAAHDQENLPVSDIRKCKSGQLSQQFKAQATGQKRGKGKQIKQVTGQKSIRDFFRI